MLALNSSCSFVRGQCLSAIVSVFTVSMVSAVFITWCGSLSVSSLYSMRLSAMRVAMKQLAPPSN